MVHVSEPGSPAFVLDRAFEWRWCCTVFSAQVRATGRPCRSRLTETTAAWHAARIQFAWLHGTLQREHRTAYHLQHASFHGMDELQRTAISKCKPCSQTLAHPLLAAARLPLLQACLQLDPRDRPTAREVMQMPYFWEIPKLISTSPLRRIYGPDGAPLPSAIPSGPGLSTARVHALTASAAAAAAAQAPIAAAAAAASSQPSGTAAALLQAGGRVAHGSLGQPGQRVAGSELGKGTRLGERERSAFAAVGPVGSCSNRVKSLTDVAASLLGEGGAAAGAAGEAGRGVVLVPLVLDRSRSGTGEQPAAVDAAVSAVQGRQQQQQQRAPVGALGLDQGAAKAATDAGLEVRLEAAAVDPRMPSLQALQKAGASLPGGASAQGRTDVVLGAGGAAMGAGGEQALVPARRSNTENGYSPSVAASGAGAAGAAVASTAHGETAGQGTGQAALRQDTQACLVSAADVPGVLVHSGMPQGGLDRGREREEGVEDGDEDDDEEEPADSEDDELIEYFASRRKLGKAACAAGDGQAAAGAKDMAHSGVLCSAPVEVVGQQHAQQQLGQVDVAPLSTPHGLTLDGTAPDASAAEAVSVAATASRPPPPAVPVKAAAGTAAAAPVVPTVEDAILHAHRIAVAARSSQEREVAAAAPTPPAAKCADSLGLDAAGRTATAPANPRPPLHATHHRATFSCYAPPSQLADEDAGADTLVCGGDRVPTIGSLPNPGLPPRRAGGFSAAVTAAAPGLTSSGVLVPATRHLPGHRVGAGSATVTGMMATTSHGTLQGFPGAAAKRSSMPNAPPPGANAVASSSLHILMYEALPEIGTPGGAPEVPAGTPPRRRAVMSGFTPCRTAAAKATAEGAPAAAVAAAVAAAMNAGSLLVPASDIPLAHSPVHADGAGQLGFSSGHYAAAPQLPSLQQLQAASASLPGGGTGTARLAAHAEARRARARQACLRATVAGQMVAAPVSAVDAYHTGGGGGPEVAAAPMSDTGMHLPQGALLSTSPAGLLRGPNPMPHGVRPGAGLPARGPAPPGAASTSNAAASQGHMTSAAIAAAGAAGVPPPGARALPHSPARSYHVGQVGASSRSRLGGSGMMLSSYEDVHAHALAAEGASGGQGPLRLAPYSVEGELLSPPHTGAVQLGLSPRASAGALHLVAGAAGAAGVLPVTRGRGMARWACTTVEALPEDEVVLSYGAVAAMAGGAAAATGDAVCMGDMLGGGEAAQAAFSGLSLMSSDWEGDAVAGAKWQKHGRAQGHSGSAPQPPAAAAPGPPGSISGSRTHLRHHKRVHSDVPSNGSAAPSGTQRGLSATGAPPVSDATLAPTPRSLNSAGGSPSPRHHGRSGSQRQALQLQPHPPALPPLDLPRAAHAPDVRRSGSGSVGHSPRTCSAGTTSHSGAAATTTPRSRLELGSGPGLGGAPAAQVHQISTAGVGYPGPGGSALLEESASSNGVSANSVVSLPPIGGPGELGSAGSSAARGGVEGGTGGERGAGAGGSRGLEGGGGAGAGSGAAGSGRSSKWPKALLGSRLIASWVKKLKDLPSSSSNGGGR